MFIAKVFLVTIFFFITFAFSNNYSPLSRIFRSNDNQLSREKKYQKEPEYFEQCNFVNVSKKQLGHVSVLAFLDPAWLYSFRQAVMLKALSSRLQKSGFPDIRFFVIAPPSDFAENVIENDIEIKLWKEIAARIKTENFVNANGYFLKDIEPELIFLQDDSRFHIWKRFRASKDQVIVIDRCGKLTYRVIVPWSILYLPYVKAAILSTYLEDPCGSCDSTIYQALSTKEDFLSLINSTDKEANRRKSNDANTDSNWTERPNFTTHFDESLEEKHEASTISFISFEVTDSTDNLNFSNVTESLESETAYQYDNGVTESAFNDENNSNAEETQNQESINLETSTVFNKTAMTFELQQDVAIKEKEEFSYTRTPINDNFITENYENTSDRILLLDEPVTSNVKKNLTSFTKTTVSNADRDEIRGKNIIHEEDERFKESALPLRIIMYAPHIHRNGRKTNKYTHLVLKTGNLDFHGHLDSEINVTSTNLWRVTNSEERDWGTLKSDVDKNTNQKYAYDRDESPGLYGEIADCWNSCEDNIINDRNEMSNDNSNNSTISYNEEHYANDSAENFSKSEVNESYSIENITLDANIKNITNSQNIVGLDKIASTKPFSINDKEEKMRNKTIEHYFKLKSWIDYRLNK